VLAIGGPQVAMRDIPNKIFKHKIGRLLFYLHPLNDFVGTSEGGQFQLPLPRLALDGTWRNRNPLPQTNGGAPSVNLPTQNTFFWGMHHHQLACPGTAQAWLGDTPDTTA